MAFSKTTHSRDSMDSSDSQSPVAKRQRSNSPVLPEVITETVSLSLDDNAIFAAIDNDVSDFTEEIVVTIDHVDDVALIDDSFQTADSFVDPLSLVQTVTSTPGGQLLSEGTSECEKPSSVFVFKDPNFVHSSKGPGGSKRTRVWKNLKQIIAAERVLPWGPDDVTYGSIDAPPSFKPAKKYSDISGLEARYTDPQTKMRYANADEYRRVRMLPGDIVAGCLHLRKANTLVP
ncbi:hypothetical protein BsWGS_04810 [Bradybaena similaris]